MARLTQRDLDAISDVPLLGDVPKLLAEVRRLRAMLCVAVGHPGFCEATDIHAEVEAIRAEARQAREERG